ncbi:MAG TPA: thioredoxin-disulfide reductase [Planctomycetota bacterium]|nr:thioredoxin-disulfide reductase [Planctomycetota bacterium]
MIYDIIIIGGGPAGLTAGIYTTRALMKTLLLEKIAPGGLVITTEKVENYPGFADGVNGYDLMDQMIKQAEKFGLETASEAVISISQSDRSFYVKTAVQEYQALSVIIASGTVYRNLGVDGERAFIGRGISYCATCDAPLFRNKEVVVVGGGDAAIEEALFLTKFVKKLYLIHRRDKLRASAILQERAKQNSKIEFIWNSVIDKVVGTGKIEKVGIRNVLDGSERGLNIDGIFVFIGFEPNTVFLKDFVNLDKEGYVITDSGMKTSCEGVFAAGDVRSNTLRQIITACGDGARAAVSAQHFVENLKGIDYKS